SHRLTEPARHLPRNHASNGPLFANASNRACLSPAIVWLARAFKVVPPLLPSASTVDRARRAKSGLVGSHAWNLVRSGMTDLGKTAWETGRFMLETCIHISDNRF